MRKVFALYILVVGSFVFSEAPAREEQFIYSILAFNGNYYSGTFTRKDADTIYLIADVDNYLTVRKAFIYYWPITQDWKTDTSVLNIPFEGILELTAVGKKPQMIGMIPYTYYNVRGEYKLHWKVAEGIDADRVWQHYQDVIDDYWLSASEFGEKQAAFAARRNELTAKIIRMRNEKRDVTALLEALRTLEAPVEPEFPKEYIKPPVPIQQAFKLNLPVGQYRIRFITEDGSVMEGSEKRLQVFSKRQSGMIAFEVIPRDLWTGVQELMDTVLWIEEDTNILLLPFYCDEYNELYYHRMRRNDSEGDVDNYRWFRIKQVPDITMELVGMDNSQSIILKEQPFYVERLDEQKQGYKVVPYEPEGKHKDREPSLRAFNIQSIPPGQYEIKLFDQNGRMISNYDKAYTEEAPYNEGKQEIEFAQDDATHLEFIVRDSVSKNWVWNTTIRLQNRVIRSYFQADQSPAIQSFTQLKPGEVILEISAPSYMARSVPLSLKRGANRLDEPIELVGYEIPNLAKWIVFEDRIGNDFVQEIRPVSSTGQAVINHPCIDLWIGAQISVQIYNGLPAQEETEGGSVRGERLYKGILDWEWDAVPETTFRYSSTIPGSQVKANSDPYWVIDYLIVVPDPRKISRQEVDKIIEKAWNLPLSDIYTYLRPYKSEGKLTLYTFSSWNVKGLNSEQ
jgi:hypothetical protein